MKGTTIKRKLAMSFLAVAVTILARPVWAEAPKVSGYVDFNTSYNFSMPVTGMTPLRFYYDDLDRDFNSNAHVAITGNVSEKASYAVEVDMGNDATLTSADDDFDIQEAYLTTTFGHGFGAKVGKFATFQGIEVIEAPANPTISRGYLFGLAECFTHVGGVGTWAMGKFDVALGAVNGWDLNNDNNDSKTLVWKAGFNGGDPLLLTLSGYHGPEQAETVFTSSRTDTSGLNRSNIDLTGLTKLIPKVDLWFQFNYGQEDATADFDGDGTADDLGKWSGAGIQPIVKITDKFSIGTRLETFSDPDGVRTGTDDLSATNFTVTPSIVLSDGLVLRLEFRQDNANKKIFVDDKGTAKDTANSAAAQLVLSF